MTKKIILIALLVFNVVFVALLIADKLQPSYGTLLIVVDAIYVLTDTRRKKHD